MWSIACSVCFPKILIVLFFMFSPSRSNKALVIILFFTFSLHGFASQVCHFVSYTSLHIYHYHVRSKKASAKGYRINGTRYGHWSANDTLPFWSFLTEGGFFEWIWDWYHFTCNVKVNVTVLTRTNSLCCKDLYKCMCWKPINMPLRYLLSSDIVMDHMNNITLIFNDVIYRMMWIGH